MKRLKITLFLLGLMALMSGCETTGSGEPGSQTGDGSDAATGKSSGYGGVETQGIGGGTGRSGSPLDDPQSPLSKRTIYFLYDSAEVEPEYVPVVNAHAAYLAANPSIVVTLEGHADERGSREYNIALGEQRASTVARMLQLQGVTDGQLNIVSYGEEKPVAFGHDDTAWQLNRRVKIAYPGY